MSKNAKKSPGRAKLLKDAQAEIAARLAKPDDAPAATGAAKGEPVATESAGTPVPPTSGTTGGKGGKGRKAKAAKAPKPKADKKAKAKKERKTGCLDAAAQVLTEAKGALGCAAMVEKMLAKGLWETSGKTPAATLYAAIIRDIAAKGKASRFRKTERGMFAAAGA